MFGLEINIVMQTYEDLEGCVIHSCIELIYLNSKLEHALEIC